MSDQLLAELQSIVFGVVSEIDELETKYDANWDDTSFVFPDWFIALWNAAQQCFQEQRHAQYLIDHERDVRVGMIHWWSGGVSDREPARALLERRFKSYIAIELKSNHE